MARRQPRLTAPFLRELSVIPGAALPDQYPFNLRILQKGRLRLRFTGRITILVGENGTGKSSLLEAIAAQCGFNLSGGSRNNVYGQEQSARTFAGLLRLAWLPRIGTGFFLRAESFFNFATHVDDIQRDDPRMLSNYGGISLHQQSHGESFLALFQNRFGGRALLLLDEPEAALSPTRQFKFLKILRQLEVAGQTQIIMATHSPLLMAYPGAQLFYVDEGGSIRETAFDETPHFRTMKDFMDDPRGALTSLLDE